MNAELVKVHTVYGDQYLVARADLSGSRTQLPLYCANGTKKSAHAECMNWSQVGHTLHRGNIEEEL